MSVSFFFYHLVTKLEERVYEVESFPESVVTMTSKRTMNLRRFFNILRNRFYEVIQCIQGITWTFFLSKSLFSTQIYQLKIVLHKAFLFFNFPRPSQRATCICTLASNVCEHNKMKINFYSLKF